LRRPAARLGQFAAITSKLPFEGHPGAALTRILAQPSAESVCVVAIVRYQGTWLTLIVISLERWARAMLTTNSLGLHRRVGDPSQNHDLKLKFFRAI
jgi:hypothetical protein